jgi:hypothetical protein
LSGGGGSSWNIISTGPSAGEGSGKLLLKDLSTSAGLVMTLNGSGHVGLGTTNPSTNLDVESSSSPAFKLVDGTQGSGKILASDGSGNASWVNPSLFGVTG